MQAGVLGSSLLAMVAPSCVGLAQHARLGNVDWRMAAGLAAGTALGSFAGSKVAVNAPTGKLSPPPPGASSPPSLPYLSACPLICPSLTLTGCPSSAGLGNRGAGFHWEWPSAIL